jgi:exopolysaccharide biosynthesis polyprenyl glycosylphosphotransferase
MSNTGPRFTQQTTAPSLPLSRHPARHAPAPRASLRARAHGPLQLLLEDPGWRVVVPLVDLLMLCAAAARALGGVQAALHISSTNAPLLALPALTMLALYVRGLYRTRLRALVLDGLIPAVSAVSVATMVVAAIGVLANGHIPSQSAWVTAWALSLLTLGAGRATLALAQRWARGRRLIGRPVLIMGAGVVGAQVARRLEDHPEYGLYPAGFLDNDPRPLAEVGGRDVPVLGTADDLDEVVARTRTRHLIVAFSSVADAHVSRLIQHCQELGVEVSVVPRMFDTINNRVGYDTVGGLPLLSFTTVNPKGVQFALKHAFDRAFAALLLLALSPVLALTALAVRLTSPGPILFRQRRVGRDGTLFDLYKFRSMRISLPGDPGSEEVSANGHHASLNGHHASRNGHHASRNGHHASRNGHDSAGSPLATAEFALPADTAPGGVEGADRRTPIGRFLRRTSLDELPQLFNVLRGDMSVIGPRPERPEFVELFREDVARYGDRHRVKSGITGWAQVHGLRGQTSLAERVEWDNYYIAHWSLALDLKILALTFGALLHNAE